MVAQMEKKATTGSQAGPCQCGCAPCDQTSCGLDCAVQPRYFCGQLLTDADLTAGMTWSQGKFRLARRRDGWGVVCGLGVGCGPKPGVITIDPGYAVDCCGNDIVVCAEATLDVNQLFQPAPQRCDPTPKQPAVEVGKQVQSSGVIMVDIAIHYQEEQLIPATTLGRAACGQSGACEFSRIKESYRLTGETVMSETEGGKSEYPRVPDPNEKALNRWKNEYAAGFSPLQSDLSDYKQEPKPDQLQRVLNRWIAAHPIYQFCWLSGFLTTTDPAGWLRDHKRSTSDALKAPELIFLVAQDGINRFLARACSACEDQGVPLARVWLRNNGSQARPQYTVEQISALPPFSRPQQPDALPSMLGEYNAGELIWREPADARAMLARLGIRLMETDHPLNLTSLKAVFDQFANFMNDPLLRIGGEYDPVTYRDPVNGLRVVGFIEHTPEKTT